MQPVPGEIPCSPLLFLLSFASISDEMIQYTHPGPTPRSYLPPPQASSSPAVPCHLFGFHPAGPSALSRPRWDGIVGLCGSKKPLVELLPVDRVKRKAVQKRIRYPEVSALPTPLHLIREPALALLNGHVFTTPHCRENVFRRRSNVRVQSSIPRAASRVIVLVM